MSDPASVQFRREAERGQMICGEFNAKNKYGGYVGFQPYLYEKKKRRLSFSQLPDFEQLSEGMGEQLSRAHRERLDSLDDQCIFASAYLSACHPPSESGWAEAAGTCTKLDFHSLRLKIDALPLDR